MNFKKLFRFGIFLIPVVIIFSQCLTSKKKADDPRGAAYAGSATCISCHKDLSSSYVQTAHFLSAQPANSHTLHGSFSNGTNVFDYNPQMKVVMDKRDSGFFQTGYANGYQIASERFDIILGSVKGESYLTWQGNSLYQLPVSSIESTHKWISSPGYDLNHIDFERTISIRCLECHTSYIKEAPPTTQSFTGQNSGFDKTSLIYNIDCERCHGPAANHVKYQLENPKEKIARYITTYSSLTRDQKINMCAVCHSGTGSKILKSTFNYTPNDTLTNFIKMSSAKTVDYNFIDVHGNQNALLRSSKCFTGSSTMVCSTCHNTHVNQRGNAAIFNSRCLDCHKTTIHSFQAGEHLSDAVLANNCVACHMPAKKSKVITAESSGLNKTLTFNVHTHHIALYPDEMKKVLTYLKERKTN